jgi:hypothetical protein
VWNIKERGEKNVGVQKNLKEKNKNKYEKSNQQTPL